MNNNPECPSCSASDWQVLGTKHYSRSQQAPDAYNRLRREVLFELWFPGQQDVALESIGCERCGFACYRPRPGEANIQEKYEYINQNEDGGLEFTEERGSDAIRARDLYNYLKEYHGSKTCEILDYGGGNGRLLGDFLSKGHRCSVLELVDKTLDGVNYAGKTLAELEHGSTYDLIVCNHVLEHLVHPLETIETLSGYLGDSGHLYIEVPSEIWRQAPPKIDPVTHINFFTTASMATMIGCAGMQVVSCEYHTFCRPNGMTGIAVKAIARKLPVGLKAEVKFSGLEEVHRLINANIIDRLMRLIKYPRMLSNVFKQAKR